MIRFAGRRLQGESLVPALTTPPASATLSVMADGATKRQAIFVIRTLRKAGHEALLAGGCVRDMLMDRRPADYDVATSATPKQVKALFRRVIMVGAKFGVAMVVHHGRPIEVATFRTDLSYSDGRRPDKVQFVSAREDARRRDFTINGMFYDPLDGRVVDYINGQADLKAGIIRAIGRPDRRFSEDYLRMLRAVRFAARLGFRIEPATAKSIARHAEKIVHISGERIREEMEKMLSDSSAAWAVRELDRLGLLRAVLGELFVQGDTWPAARRRVDIAGRRGDLLMTLAALLGDLPKVTVTRIIRRWGGANSTRDALVWMGEHRDDWRTLETASLAQVKQLLAHRAFDTLQALWRVRERAETAAARRSAAIARRIGRIDPDQIRPAAFVTGANLKRLGLAEGPKMGRILDELYEEQLNEHFASRREALARSRQLVGPQTHGS